MKDKGNLGVPPVSRVELVRRTSLWGYQGSGGANKPFLKITCALPNLVTSCRSEWSVYCLCVCVLGVTLGVVGLCSLCVLVHRDIFLRLLPAAAGEQQLLVSHNLLSTHPGPSHPPPLQLMECLL